MKELGEDSAMRRFRRREDPHVGAHTHKHVKIRQPGVVRCRHRRAQEAGLSRRGPHTPHVRKTGRCAHVRPKSRSYRHRAEVLPQVKQLQEICVGRSLHRRPTAGCSQGQAQTAYRGGIQGDLKRPQTLN